MELLEFARGPGLAIALAVFGIGMAWRLFSILRRPSRRDLAAPRAGTPGPVAGAARAIATHMVHAKNFRRRSLARSINAYAYHVGLALVVFGFMPHIAFVERLTGLAWPAIPGWLFVLGVAMTFVGLAYAAMERLSNPVLRLLSGFDDWFSWAVTAAPMLTGMALLSLPLASRYPLVPDRPLAVTLHLLSLELLLAWLPFGKLAHAFLVFFSRGATGAAFARRGAAA